MFSDPLYWTVVRKNVKRPQNKVRGLGFFYNRLKNTQAKERKRSPNSFVA